MAKQVIGIGNAANDGSGDPLRTAGDKINDNFNEFYSKVGDGTNLYPLTFPNANATVLTTSYVDVGTSTTSSSDADHILVNDGGILKKITPANLGIGSAYTLLVQEEGTNTSTTGATTLNFVGAGVTATGNGATKTITIAGSSSQNLFSTVASSGQNNIVADGTTDTLYIEAGTGINITTDQNTDTLTITAALAPDTVTYDMMQDTSATDVVLGRYSSGAGTVQELSMGTLRSIMGLEYFKTIAVSGQSDVVADSGLGDTLTLVAGSNTVSYTHLTLPTKRIV